jgi:hypothetical protein
VPPSFWRQPGIEWGYLAICVVQEEGRLLARLACHLPANWQRLGSVGKRIHKTVKTKFNTKVDYGNAMSANAKCQCLPN